MPETLKGRIVLPKEIFGSSRYTLFVELTNLTDKVISITSISPDLVPGIVVGAEETATTSKLDELEDQKKKLVKELDAQVSVAYDRIYNKQTPWSRIANVTTQILANITISGLFFRLVQSEDESKPSWASQALKIDEWSDVEHLEIEIINQLKENDFLRKAFQINKEKLGACLEKISKTENSILADVSLDTITFIQPKETASFPFICVSPFLMSAINSDIQFSVAYKSEELKIQGTLPIRDASKVNASKSAITIGGILGALLGFVVKSTLMTRFEWFDKTFWSTLIGSVFLAIIIVLGTAKSSDVKRIISIENLGGGLLAGALCALFSNKLILYLENLLPK